MAQSREFDNRYSTLYSCANWRLDTSARVVDTMEKEMEKESRGCGAW